MRIPPPEVRTIMRVEGAVYASIRSLWLLYCLLFRHIVLVPGNAVMQNLTTATTYVQGVSKQTDTVIENSRNYVLRGQDVA